MNHPTVHLKITIRQPRKPLCDNVVAAVCAAQVRERQNDRRIFGIVVFASSVLFVPAVVMTVRAFAASNFGSYLSLFFSDAGSINLYWRELGMGLAESLPVVSIALMGALVGTLAWSTRKLYLSTQHARTVRFA